jgi:uncharacterized protein (TIGR03083 family)
MDQDQLWAAIDSQRLRTVELLDDLTPAEWEQASLCDGWTVRDVAAHLTMQQMTLLAGLKGFLRHPGKMNHVIHAAAVSGAARPTDQLLREIGSMVGSRRTNVGLTPRETLIDIIVHGQDIAIPLRRRLDVEPEAAKEAATQVWSYRTSRKGRRMARVFRPLPSTPYRLIATDTDWSAGDGPEVRGPTLALLLLLTGRRAGYAQLDGPGVAALGTALGLHGADD